MRKTRNRLNRAHLFIAILVAIIVGTMGARTPVQASDCMNPRVGEVCLPNTKATWWIDGNNANYDAVTTSEWLSGQYQIVSFTPEIPAGTYTFMPGRPDFRGRLWTRRPDEGGTLIADPGQQFTVYSQVTYLVETYPPFAGESPGYTWRLLARQGGLTNHPLAGTQDDAWGLPATYPTVTVGTATATVPGNPPTATSTSTTVVQPPTATRTATTMPPPPTATRAPQQLTVQIKDKTRHPTGGWNLVLGCPWSGPRQWSVRWFTQDRAGQLATRVLVKVMETGQILYDGHDKTSPVTFSVNGRNICGKHAVVSVQEKRSRLTASLVKYIDP